MSTLIKFEERTFSHHVRYSSSQTRRAPDALLLSNSTLLVQVFFLLSSFLLANKILRQHEVPLSAGTDSVLHTARLFCSTMLHRIIR